MTQSSVSLEEKIQKSPSADKVMITVLWDCEGVIVVDAMPRGETVKSDAYIRTPTEHGKHFRRVWPLKNPAEISMTVQGRTQAG